MKFELSSNTKIKMYRLVVLALAFFSASAFVPAHAPKVGSARDAGMIATLQTLQGPEIMWGDQGPLNGKEESDIKGYDNFDQLVGALQSAGVDLEGGEYTLLAPSNSAIAKHNTEVGTPIDANVLKYHVITGKKSLDQLTVDQPTLQGGTLTSYRKFRKNWLDNSIIGLKSEGASKSSNWPADVATDRGMIHAIDTVLVPGAYTGSR